MGVVCSNDSCPKRAPASTCSCNPAGAGRESDHLHGRAAPLADFTVHWWENKEQRISSSASENPLMLCCVASALPRALPIVKVAGAGSTVDFRPLYETFHTSCPDGRAGVES